MKEIDRFKTNISLIDYIEANGGVINEEKSSQSSKIIDFNDSKFIVSKNDNEHYVYFDTFNNKNQGTIIDFYQKNINLKADFKATILALRKFEKDGYITKNAINKNTTKKEIDIQSYYNSLKILDKKDIENIVKIRKIDENIINKFKYTIRKDNKNNIVFINNSFNIYPNSNNVSQVCGFSKKNLTTNFKGEIGEKGLWGSPYLNPNSKNIYLFESSFDALAFSDLTQKEGQYIAFNGSFGEKQLLYLENLIQRITGQKLVCCFDNDKIGESYTQKIKEKFTNINIEVLKPSLKDFNEDLIHKKNILYIITTKKDQK